MANRSCGRGRQVRSTAASRSGTLAFTEPEVRRWPHPVEGTEVTSDRQTSAVGQADTSLYYIHCSLSYQNQLLADIKSLLEQLAADMSQTQEEK